MTPDQLVALLSLLADLHTNLTKRDAEIETLRQRIGELEGSDES